MFPAAIEDAVLLDDERRAISPWLGVSTGRLDESVGVVMARLAAIGCSASSVCLSYSCRDTRQFRDSFPSWILLQACRLQQGHPALSYKDVDAVLGEPTSAVAAVQSAALSDADWWLAGVARHGAARPRVLAAFPSLALGARADDARASEAFTEFDGHVPAAGGVLDLAQQDRVMSATSLESAAKCPFRYFLKYGLGVRPLEESTSDTDAWLDPLTKGSELHDVFARAMRVLRDEGRKPDQPRDVPRIRAWGQERLDALRASMPPPSDEVCARESREFLDDLEAFMVSECEGRYGDDPVGFEVAFGFPLELTDGEPLATPERLTLNLGGGRSLVLHGWIDRINRLRPGEYEVVDYKTGGYWPDSWKGSSREAPGCSMRSSDWLHGWPLRTLCSNPTGGCAAMSKQTTPPGDQAVRDRLVAEFRRNFLVEAGAGSGKTHSLAMRMAAGIAAGEYTVEHMAAVTFTRKAAAELRGRFQLALEALLSAEPADDERQRLDRALSGLERLFAGTIHAFCAHLLRERPVDARVAPGFVEFDDVENQRVRGRAWRDYVAAARAGGFKPMLDLLDAGVKPEDLDHAFGIVCEHEDVEFDMGGGEAPDFDAEFSKAERFWRALARFKPDTFADDSKCKAQQKYVEFDSRLASARRTRSLAQLAALLTFWNHTPLTMKWWGTAAGGSADDARKARDLVEAFQTDVIDPFLLCWRAYVHRLAMAVLPEARDGFARYRRRLNVVNDVDLLRVTVSLLRNCPDVRRALQRKYRWLFVDEFQDTDPIQAEIFLLLAGDEEGVRGNETPAWDPVALPLRAGALFVVGDPKQSIFRFRRADIDIYNRVASRIRESGGDVLSLTANFRSLPAVCDLANRVCPSLFAGMSYPYSPVFTVLEPVRVEGPAGRGHATGAPLSRGGGGSGRRHPAPAWQA